MLSPPSYRLRSSSASEVRSPPVIRLPLPRSAVFVSAMSPLRVGIAGVAERAPARSPMITRGPPSGHRSSGSCATRSGELDQVGEVLAPGVLGAVGQQDHLVGV